MIGYVTLGTNQLEAATGFYDELFKVIGAGRVYEGDNFCAAYFRDLDGNKLNAFCMVME